MSVGASEIVRLEGVTKAFGDNVAVFQASLAIARGRIHAVVGENGAGKSTLLKIAAGVLEPDAGRVLIDAEILSPHTARGAIARGVAMVQQHFALIPVFTALENVMLGTEPVKSFGRLDANAARVKIAAIAKELGASLSLDASVESLGVGERQQLEIVRALYRDARVVILDEPTAVLTPDEATALYATMRRLADTGRAIVVVTHKLDEVRAHADDVTVLRKGEVIFSRAIDRTSLDREMSAITEAAMGQGASDAVVRETREHVAPKLVVRDVHVARALDGVSLEVRGGEIVGIAGVLGNGQRELVEILSNERALDAGAIEVHGTSRAATRDAIAVVHEDRQREGLVLDASIADNVLLGDLARFAHLGVLDGAAMEREVAARFAKMHVTFAAEMPARALSGGNQQKIVMGRALAQIDRGRTVLVLAHPTRGVDIAASAAIHRDILAAAKGGAAVLVMSADLHELRTLSDRILVLARGKVVGEFPNTATDAELGRAMLEGTDHAHVASAP